ncbi:MAG: BTAD domain-containing putative transcriptional regulator [Deinococcota bacterium]
MDGLELTLLGTPKLYWQAKPVASPAPKNLLLLCYLALKPEPQPREHLTQLFWPGGKRASLRFALHKLRQLPGADDWLQTPDNCVNITATSDVMSFEEALHQGHFEEALSVWQDEVTGAKTLLHGLQADDCPELETWLEQERTRLQSHYLEALQGRLRELERAGEAAAALRLARDVLRHDELNEAVHRSIMRLEADLGNSDAALVQFERLRELLHSELGLEPEAETHTLLTTIEDNAPRHHQHARVIASPAEVPALATQLVGRTSLLEEIRHKLTQHQHMVLQGFGGTGKTALAAQLAADTSQQGQVLWLEAGHDALDALLDGIARAYDDHTAFVQSANPAEFIYGLLERHAPLLIVVDDACNAYALSQFRDIIPAQQRLLVTSRQQHRGLPRVQVTSLTREDALTLLSSHTQRDLSQDSDASRLCDILDNHPFSLRLAGITLAVDGLTTRELLARLSTTPHDLKAPAQSAQLAESTSTYNSVTAMLSTSLDSLPEDVYEAFMSIGNLFTSSCTADLLAELEQRSVSEAEDALFELYQRGLAQRQSEAGSDIISYRLHDLAYSLARARNHHRPARAAKACEQFMQRFVQRQAHTFQLLDVELHNMLGAAQYAHAHDKPDVLVSIMQKLVVGNAYFTARGHSPSSLALLEQAVTAAKTLGDLETAHFLVARLGDTYRNSLADTKRALAAYEDALELVQNLNNSHREVILRSLIGSLQFQLGESAWQTQLDAAYQLAKREQDNLGLSHVLQNLSYLAGVREHYAEAERYCLEALTVLEAGHSQTTSSQASDIPAETIESLFFVRFNLGVAQHKQRKFGVALTCLEQALALAEQHNNPLWTAYIQQEMGDVYHAQGRRASAQQHYHQALSLYEANNASSDYDELAAFLSQHAYPLPEDIPETPFQTHKNALLTLHL